MRPPRENRRWTGSSGGFGMAWGGGQQAKIRRHHGLVACNHVAMSACGFGDECSWTAPNEMNLSRTKCHGWNEVGY